MEMAVQSNSMEDARMGGESVFTEKRSKNREPASAPRRIVHALKRLQLYLRRKSEEESI